MNFIRLVSPRILLSKVSKTSLDANTRKKFFSDAAYIGPVTSPSAIPQATPGDSKASLRKAKLKKYLLLLSPAILAGLVTIGTVKSYFFRTEIEAHFPSYGAFA
jgi:hypothetical protein